MVQEVLLWLILIFRSVGPVPDRKRFSSPSTYISGTGVRSPFLYRRLSRVIGFIHSPMQYRVRPYIFPVDLRSGW